MIKRNILIAITAVTAICNVVLNIINPYDNYIVILLLSILFYLIIFVNYRKNIALAIFCVLVIISLTGQHLLLYNMANPPANGYPYQLYGSMSLLGSILSFLLAFILTLQHKYYKFIEVSLLVIAVFNLIFFSFINFSITGVLVQIYGPYEIDIERMFYIYNGIVIAIRLIIGILQIFIIYLLDKNEKKKAKELEEFNKLFNN